MPRGATVDLQKSTPVPLRRSPRFSCQEKKCDIPVTVTPGSGGENLCDVKLASMKSGGERISQESCAPKKSSKLTQSSSKAGDEVTSISGFRRTTRANCFRDFTRSLRRSSRLLSRENCDNGVRKKSQDASVKLKPRDRVSGKCMKVEPLLDERIFEVRAVSTRTRSRAPLAELGSVNLPVDKEMTNHSHEMKSSSMSGRNDMLLERRRSEIIAKQSHEMVETAPRRTRRGFVNSINENYVDTYSGEGKLESVHGFTAMGILNGKEERTRSKRLHVADKEERDGKKHAATKADVVDYCRDGRAGSYKESPETKHRAIHKELDHTDRAAVGEWTEEQELALERAYFIAKPTPNFWKRVSKLVPGKSAQECFDKVHSFHITPIHSHRRPRGKKLTSSPINQVSTSASILLKSKQKRPGTSRSRKTKHLARKTIRRMLEKQSLADGCRETDLFSVLEQVEALPNTDITPNEKARNVGDCYEKSYSSRKRPHSRFIGSSREALVSPPVLKQVKDKAMHERYIDQLHIRQAKREAEFARLSRKENTKAMNDQNTDMIRAAKNALAFDLKDAINKLRSLQEDSSGSSSEYLFCDDDTSE